MEEESCQLVVFMGHGGLELHLRNEAVTSWLLQIKYLVKLFSPRDITKKKYSTSNIYTVHAIDAQ